jgi:hypothetical protein
MNADEIRIIEDEGRRRAEFRTDYRRGLSRWKGGLCGKVEAIVRGLLGEWATARWLNERFGERLFELDTVLRERGDGGKDFDCFGVKIDVKATSTPMVRRIDDGRLIALRADIYVFGDARKHSLILLCGWITQARMIEVSPVCKTPIAQATHFNLEPPLQELEHMKDLFRRLKVERRKCH